MKLDLALPLVALLAHQASAASSVMYCSSVNTGSNNDANTSIYQSNGLCETSCSSEYAFGIVQGSECWCSNIAPNKATNVDLSKCDEDCPGYPSDSCGSTTDGLFGYIKFAGHNPSGTATAPSSSSTSSKSSKSSESSTEDTKTTSTGNTAVETTSGGKIKTITVPNSEPTSTSTSDSSSDDNSGLSGGAIAGVVVGSIGGVAAIAAVIFLVILARRRQRSPSPDPSVQNVLIDGRNSKGSQMSFMRGFSDNHSHTLSAGSSRHPTFTDGRMKTDTVLFGGQARRNSDMSLQDNEDYSRPVLRLTNPD